MTSGQLESDKKDASAENLRQTINKIYLSQLTRNNKTTRVRHKEQP